MIVVKYGGTIDRNITQPVIKENEKTDTNYFSACGLRMLGDRMACREKTGNRIYRRSPVGKITCRFTS